MTSEAAEDRDERSARARAAMVEALADAGAVGDPAVLQAMGRVPREAFAPRFWSLPSTQRTGTPGQVRGWRVDEDDGAIDLVYDIDRALAIRYDPEVGGGRPGAGVTSTISAPRIVGSMLEQLELAPGMKVLEIGAGSGYNAALLAELVGSEGLVVSVDIDAGLVSEAAGRLKAAGYGDVRVLAADGHFGVSELAPFDRVVATVGCIDLAPAWRDQLAAGGFCLLPLQHGGWHPLTRIEVVAGLIKAQVVGRASFVAIQGHQAGHSPWLRPGPLGPHAGVDWTALPEDLAAELQPETGREELGGLRMWDLGYLLALEDRRTAFGLSLATSDSSAAIEPSGSRIGCVGPAGPELRDRILEVAAAWIELGRPAVGDYESTLVPLIPAPDVVAPTPSSWLVDRIDFRQIVTLHI